MTVRPSPQPEGVQRLRLEGLGQRVVRVGGVELRPEHERVFGLAVRLVMAEGSPVSRGELTDLLWPATRAETRRQSLRQLVYRLRQLGAPVEASSGDVRIDPAWCEHDAASPEPGRLVRASAERIALLTQPWMPGWEPRWSSAMRDWVDETRSEVATRLRAVLVRAVALAREAGRWEQIELLSRGLLRADPLHEEGTLALAEALAATGSKAAALDLLDTYAAEVGRRRRDLALAPSLLRSRLSEQPWTPAPLGVESPFVGRDAELGRLTAALGRAQGGTGTTHVVVGEAGIGKTRLLEELADAAARVGVGVVRQVGDVNSSLQGFGAIAGVARQLEDRPGALGASPSNLALLRALSGRVTGPVPAASLAPGPVLAALRDLLTAVTHEGPLVLVVDDCHLLDEASMAVLVLLAQETVRLPLALVLSTRPHASEPLEGMSAGPGVLVLGPLDEAATRTLALDVGERTGMVWGERELAECVALSGGHPMFVRELVAHWRGRVRGDGRPVALVDLLRARMQALPDGPLRLLQTVAVLGRFSTLDRLVVLTAVAPQELVSQMAALDARCLLAGSSASPQVRHGLLAEAALELLPERALGALHGFAARELLAEATAGASSEVVVDCATHFARAGEVDRATLVLRGEVERLARGGGTAEMARLLPTALRELRGTPDREPLLRMLLQATTLAGGYADALSAAGQLGAESGAPGLGVRRLGPRVLRAAAESMDDWAPWMAEALSQVGDASLPMEDRIGAALEAVRMGDGMHDVPYLLRVHAVAAPLVSAHPGLFASLEYEIAYNTDHGDLARAVEAARALLALSEREPSAGLRVEAYWYAAIPIFRAGDVTEARRLLETALCIAETGVLHGAAFNVVVRLWDVGLHLGDEALVAAMMTRTTELLDHGQSSEQYRYLIVRRAFTSVVMPSLVDDPGTIGDLRLSRVTATRIPMQRIHFLAAYVMHRLRARGRPGGAAVSLLATDVDAMLTHGSMDLPVTALLSYLISRYDVTAARTLLARYLSTRRDRGPLFVLLARMETRLSQVPG